MKEVKVLAWCDACADERDRVGGDVEPAVVEVGIAVAPGDRKLLDLCERHHKALVEPLARLLAEMGQSLAPEPHTPARTPERRGQKPQNPDRYPCLWCGLGFGSINGFKTHVEQVHGVEDGSLADVFGLVCPSCGETFGTSQAIAVHATRTHGAASAADIFRVAEAEGDIHGIVAARRKLGSNVG